MAHLACILDLLHPGIRDEDKVGRPSNTVTEVMRILDQHVNCRWTVAALASRVSISPSQLTRLFIRDTGIPP